MKSTVKDIFMNKIWGTSSHKHVYRVERFHMRTRRTKLMRIQSFKSWNLKQESCTLHHVCITGKEHANTLTCIIYGNDEYSDDDTSLRQDAIHFTPALVSVLHKWCKHDESLNGWWNVYILLSKALLIYTNYICMHTSGPSAPWELIKTRNKVACHSQQ